MGVASTASHAMLPAAQDFQLLFESIPGLYLVLAPNLKIVAASNAYLKATLTQREAIIGRDLFEVFPDNPQDANATGVHNLHRSLNRVLASREGDAMPIQKYDIPTSDGKPFAERYWSPFNAPVFNADGEIAYIIHRVEDVTDFVRLKQQYEDTYESAGNPPPHGSDKIAVEVFMHAKEVSQTNQKLREENAENARLMAAIVESSAEAIMSTTPHGIISSWNKGATRLFGYTADEVIGQPITLIYPPDLQNEAQYILQRVNSGERIKNHETQRLHKDGSRIAISTTISPIHDAQARVVGSSRVVHDLRERIEAEKIRDQLHHAQKMDAIGQLTGGIAHDFNNLLAVVLGNLDFVAEALPENDPLREFIQPGIEAAVHGAQLTRQLLAFGRKQTLQPQTVAANTLLDNFLPLVRRTLGERIEIALSLAPDAWNIHIDPSQLQSALLNLSVNARDAMPEGGKLIYETSNTFLDDEYVSLHPDLPIGEYVRIAVSDTGSGMDAETIEKAFEPFFTTKETGKGSGLGLSMVYGFVKQSHGHIKIYSEPGYGTSIKIYLPRATSKIATPYATVSTFAASSKTALILVVEDNKEVLKLTAAMVEKLGYQVLRAETGDTALEILKANPTIDLLLTDVMLPGNINGPVLAKQAQALYPDLKVLFNSGYAEHAIVTSGLLDEGVHLISKPFRRQQLAEKLAMLLHAPIP